MLLKYKSKFPKVSKNVFIAPGVYIIGDVIIKSKSNIWFNVVIRGDVEKIRIGSNTNIQDLTMIHCTTRGFGTQIGSNTTIGHNCVIHDCKVGNNSLVGMSSTILDGAKLENSSMLAAGSLLTQGKVIKTGELWAGKPAKFLRMLTKKEITFLKLSANRYYKLSQEYLAKSDKNY